MPCNDYSVAEEIDMATKEIRKRCHAATRAACEMAKLTKKHRCFQYLSRETRMWVESHEEADKKHAR